MAAFVDLVLLGDTGNNELRGKEGNDRIAGNDGDDILSGGSGNDIVLGGRGADCVRGGNGDDILFGGAGDDVLWGGSGADYMSGDGGADLLIGGYGADTFAFNVSIGALGDGIDRVADFVVGQDKLQIVNGSTDNVSFVDEGSSLGVYYDGVKIVVLTGVSTVPVDTSVFFGDAISL